MSTQDLTKVAQELVDAFNAGDWQRFRAVVAPDVRYDETGTQRSVHGADQYVALCQGWRQALPDVRGTIRTTVNSGNTVVQELTWEGTQTGPLETPDCVPSFL